MAYSWCPSPVWPTDAPRPVGWRSGERGAPVPVANAAEEFDTVLVVDFGAQYAQVIARRVRECHVYSEIVSSDTPLEELLARRPVGIILSGGPKSVYADYAPRVDSRVFSAGVPMLGICYGQQLMAQELGGEVARTGAAEFGKTEFAGAVDSVLLAGQPADQTVWMSHNDAVVRAPEGRSEE